MNENRETPGARAAETPTGSANPGAAIEEAEATNTEVQDAVARATNSEEGVSVEVDADVAAADAIARAPEANTELAEAAAEAERLRREQFSKVDTELNLDPVSAPAEPMRVGMIDEMPSAGPEDTGFGAAVLEAPARDGEIRISSDHPMAGFYTQAPTPPEPRGNRGAGILIALLAAISFSGLLASVMMAEFGVTINASRAVDLFFGASLAWVFFAAVGTFLAALILLVVIVGRAGWWAYVLGGFLVGALVWFAVTLSLAAISEGVRKTIGGLPAQSPEGFGELIAKYGLSLYAIAAGVLAREVTVWFGAWIGARGRKTKERNALALAEYEEALAEAQVKQP